MLQIVAQHHWRVRLRRRLLRVHLQVLRLWRAKQRPERVGRALQRGLVNIFFEQNFQTWKEWLPIVISRWRNLLYINNFYWEDMGDAVSATSDTTQLFSIFLLYSFITGNLNFEY